MQQQGRSTRAPSWVPGRLLSLTTAAGKGNHKQSQPEAGLFMSNDKVACDNVAASGTGTDLCEGATEQLLQKGVFIRTCPCSSAQLLHMYSNALHTTSISRAVDCICSGYELS